MSVEPEALTLSLLLCSMSPSLQLTLGIIKPSVAATQGPVQGLPFLLLLRGLADLLGPGKQRSCERLKLAD